MCGIAGFIGGNWTAEESNIKNQLFKMQEVIKHRGPDSKGFWIDNDNRIAFSHRRLSIIDLSKNGNQPMLSSTKRFVITYNGEIYNHLDLRSQLETAGNAPTWKGSSDTETLISSIEVWGIEKTLKKSIGMFAFAIFDRRDKIFYIARDRVGEKPLYYGWQNNVFLFGSELKAIKQHKAFNNIINNEALGLFIQHNYVPAPYSIYEGIYKLPQGSYLKLDLNNLGTSINLNTIKPKKYWNMQEIVEDGLSNPFETSEENIINRLENLLGDVIKMQMISDVPLGAFLSGGIDSSLVVALMQKHSMDKIKSFTIGFNEKIFNEAEYAKKVANHLGTDHTELYVSSKDAMKVIPDLCKYYDEPFADSSQIPTYLISKMTREHVTVALSGDAGDEFFGGYNRYLWSKKIWSIISVLPLSLRNLLSRMITSIPPNQLSSFYEGLKIFIPQKYQITQPADKINKISSFINAKSDIGLYNRLISHRLRPHDIIINLNKPINQISKLNNGNLNMDFIHRMMFIDSISYLPDDILVKVDRAAMAVSLETRIPLLDHRLIEFSWRTPLELKVLNGIGKLILRKILYKYVPQELIERPKMGFGVPIGSWLRDPLKDWAEDLLSRKKLNDHGFFISDLIRQKWKEHLSGNNNWHYDLWNILMFQSWMDYNKNQ